MRQGEENLRVMAGAEFQDRLINVAVRKGYLDADNVHAALQWLKEEQSRGRNTPLQSILLQKRLLTREQWVDVRRTMAQEGIAPRLGDYEILSRIGRGSMGTVYRARQRGLDRIVALKVLASHLASNEEFVRRFLREARLAARVNHPNIVQVFDVGRWRTRHYIAMEFVRGRSLERMLAKTGPISEALAVSVALQVAAALEQAEARGIVHRDIKPGNILVTAQGVAKLADLGLALAAGESAEDNVGTPYYMSPEQARNDANLDTRSDIYSLGCALFHAVTGRPPFEGAAALETARMHAELAPPDARAARPDLSEAFSAVLRRMMAKRTEDRYPTAAALATALEPLRAKPARSPIGAGDRSLPRPSRINALWFLAFGIAGIVLLVLLILLVASFMRGRRG